MKVVAIFRSARPLAVVLVMSIMIMAAAGHGHLAQRLGVRIAELATLAYDEVAVLSAVIALTALALVRLVDRRQRLLLRRLLEKRKGEEDAVRQLAMRDPLTDLFNRRGLEKCFKSPMPDRHGRAIVLCDLDGFKHINDTLGHAAGDNLLRDFGNRLQAIKLTGVDLQFVRLGGDEFVILVTALDALSSGVSVARSIADTLELADGDERPLSVSIGIAQGNATSSLNDLLVGADMAMYDSKKSGDPFRVFSATTASSSGVRTRLFEKHLVADESNRQFFVAAIGLDHYRRNRRTHGHGVCSKIVREIQRELERLGAMAVERMAPDTLGVLIAADDAQIAHATLNSLLDRLIARPNLSVDGLKLSLTGGLAGPSPSGALRELAEMAQNGLDEAWRTAQRIVFYDIDRQKRTEDDRVLLADLTAALANGELELHYQPKLCAKTGVIDSFEALARWTHQQFGPISPSRFVALAEQTDVIRTLTDWAIDRAIADHAELMARGLERPIYVNISARLICEPNFAIGLLERLSSIPGHIGIEITETAVLGDPERALSHLHEFAAAGISIAIDDYGVGLSSLAYLKQLPANELKIDMLFITDLVESHRDPMIVRSTIDLAHGLGLRVTAEGVDNPIAEGLLKVMGCDLLQGYQISRPLPVDSLIQFMLEHSTKCDTIDLAETFAFAA